MRSTFPVFGSRRPRCPLRCAENQTGPSGDASAQTSWAPTFAGNGYSWTVTCAAADAANASAKANANLGMTALGSKRPRDRSTARAGAGAGGAGPFTLPGPALATAPTLHRMPGDAEPRRAHVVAAELPQGVTDEAADDFLPPVDVEVGVVERLRARGDLRPRLRDDVVRQPPADEHLAALGDDRLRRHRAEDDPRVLDRAIGRGAHRRRHAEHREIERTAPPQFPVAGLPATGVGQAHLGEDLVGLPREVLDAIVQIQVGGGDLALARGRNEFHLRIER